MPFHFGRTEVETCGDSARVAQAAAAEMDVSDGRQFLHFGVADPGSAAVAQVEGYDWALGAVVGVG